MSAIIDNWTLQNIGEFISEGFSRHDLCVIEVGGNAHDETAISECIIQTEALFDVLTDIVLRETLVVDGEYAYTWESADSPIMILDQENLIRRKPFQNYVDDFEDLRTYLVDRMCVTASLKETHAENVASWNESGQAKDQYLSQLLWGGAGMVARSSTFGFPYSPHPLRRRLFLETGLFFDGGFPHQEVQSCIDENRLRLLKAGTSDSQSYSLRVLLPPIPVQVINESNSPSDLFKIAMQLRKDYAPLRGWLAEVEEAVGKDDMRRTRKLHRVLKEVTRKVDRELGTCGSDSTLSAGLGAISLSKDIYLGNLLIRATNVYSTLNRMVLGASGEVALKKLCRMFDADGTVIERKLREHFSPK